MANSSAKAERVDAAPPARSLAEITLLTQAERFKGRPKLCSDCGICGGELRPLMAAACVFVQNRHEQIELKIHGRNRSDGDELRFGVNRAIHIARLRQINYEAQWSGIVTRLGALLLERGLVDGVIATKAAPGTRWAPLPFLARTPAEVLATAGNKPCLSPTLEVLPEVKASGLKRLAFIGMGCQVHALRCIEADLGLEQLYVIGLPCTDNTSYPDLMRFLNVASKSPATVAHHEFMQDFRVWMRHDDGHLEKMNYVDLDVSALGGERGIFPAACLSCFDYQNGLADLTIGYLGAPLPPEQRWQWMLVRNERGQELFDLIKPLLELGERSEAGDRRVGMQAYIGMLRKPRKRPIAPIRKFVAWMQRSKGPKGFEFARSVIEMKLLRNLVFVRDQYPKHEQRIIPRYVYRALAYTADVYQREFERTLEP